MQPSHSASSRTGWCAVTSDGPCIGCGGRNPPDVTACLWCGRLLRAPERGERGARWAVLAAGLAAGLGALLVLLGGVLASQRLAAETAPAVRPPIATPATPPALVGPPAAADPPVGEEEEAATPVEFVRVANTGGLGISLRREPRADAPRITARPENTVLRVVGPDTVADGRVWREVQDAQGNRGWAPADFLVPVPPS